MKRQDINYIVSFLLLISLAITAITGYIQAQLDLRRFVPHRYFAYITLALTAIHVFFNAGKLWRYTRGKFPPSPRLRRTSKRKAL